MVGRSCDNFVGMAGDTLINRRSRSGEAHLSIPRSKMLRA